MRLGRRRRATTGATSPLEAARWFTFGGVGVSYDGRSWAPYAADDVDLDALVDEHDRRETAALA